MTQEQATRLGIETLMEVVESSENIEICVISGNKMEMLPDASL